jgi:hypothetical protein
MTFYIKCHSAMDQTFIGPFKFKKDALAFLRQHGNPEHDSWIFSKDQMLQDLVAYGKVVVQTPEGFDHEAR